MRRLLEIADIVPRETHERLNGFVRLLLKWNKTVRLVGAASEDEIWQRHVADSLQLLSLLPQSVGRTLDIGTGGGFPGLVLAICRPSLNLVLTDADRRKVAFLREAVRVTGASAQVVAGRLEETATGTIGIADVVTSRAVADLSALLTLASPRLAACGFCLFPKGATVVAELARCQPLWTMDVIQHPSLTDPSGTILQISGLRRK